MTSCPAVGHNWWQHRTDPNSSAWEARYPRLSAGAVSNPVGQGWTLRAPILGSWHVWLPDTSSPESKMIEGRWVRSGDHVLIWFQGVLLAINYTCGRNSPIFRSQPLLAFIDRWTHSLILSPQTRRLSQEMGMPWLLQQEHRTGHQWRDFRVRQEKKKGGITIGQGKSQSSGSESRICPLLAVLIQASVLTSLGLSFLAYGWSWE